MKQHHQRVLRLWRCPECDRTVRLPGRVTSRTCPCLGEPTLMQLQETERLRRFEVDPFVTYQTEEDITPTAAELIEEIPQHLMPVGPTEEELAAKAAKPRRGKAYLRTETDEPTTPDSSAGEGASEAEPEVDDFGAGLDDSTPAASTTSSVKSEGSTARRSQSSSAPSKSDSEGGGRKRRRRRRRKSGRRDADANPADGGENASVDGQTVTQPNQPSISSTSENASTGGDQSSGEQSSDESTTATPGNRRGRKRRRRRRRRGGGGAGAADNDSNSSSSSDSESAPPAANSD